MRRMVGLKGEAVWEEMKQEKLVTWRMYGKMEELHLTRSRKKVEKGWRLHRIPASYSLTYDL
jgi:hypothetical protein